MNRFNHFNPWIHKKTGNRYFSFGTAIDATNATNGREMVNYFSEAEPSVAYVREISEFLEKFEMELPKAEESKS